MSPPCAHEEFSFWKSDSITVQPCQKAFETHLPFLKRKMADRQTLWCSCGRVEKDRTWCHSRPQTGRSTFLPLGARFDHLRSFSPLAPLPSPSHPTPSLTSHSVSNKPGQPGALAWTSWVGGGLLWLVSTKLEGCEKVLSGRLCVHPRWCQRGGRGRVWLWVAVDGEVTA